MSQVSHVATVSEHAHVEEYECVDSEGSDQYCPRTFACLITFPGDLRCSRTASHKQCHHVVGQGVRRLNNFDVVRCGVAEQWKTTAHEHRGTNMV